MSSQTNHPYQPVPQAPATSSGAGLRGVIGVAAAAVVALGMGCVAFGLALAGSETRSPEPVVVRPIVAITATRPHSAAAVRLEKIHGAAKPQESWVGVASESDSTRPASRSVRCF